MRWANPNMLLRIAQADAYAVAYEYVDDNDAPLLKQEMRLFDRFYKHPTYHTLPAGTYTDDTQMSIAVAEVLLEKGVYASSRDFSDAWFRCFKRDPRDGYSRGFQSLLEQAHTADELRTLITPTSTKNGAAMRAVPLGIIKDPTRCATLAGIQATTTHATFEGINSAIAVALMSRFAHHDRRGLPSLYDGCVRHLPLFEEFKRPWEGRVADRAKTGGRDVGINTAHAVFTLLTQETSLCAIMDRVLEWGGDTDSVAAIAWGIASCRYIDEPLPEFLETCLEVGGMHGPTFLKDLGQRLMNV